MNWRIRKIKFPPNVFTCVVSSYCTAKHIVQYKLYWLFNRVADVSNIHWGFSVICLRLVAWAAESIQTETQELSFLPSWMTSRWLMFTLLLLNGSVWRWWRSLPEPHRDDMKQPHDWEHDFTSPTAGFINGMWPVWLFAYTSQLLALYFPKL